MNHCIVLAVGGPLVDPRRTTISPVNFTQLLPAADEMMHVKTIDCEMLDKCQVCVPHLYLSSFPFHFSHSQALFSAANPFLKMRLPVCLFPPPSYPMLLLFFFSSFMLLLLPRKSYNLILCLISSSVSLGLMLNSSSSRKPSFILSNGNHSLDPSHHTPKAG